MSLPDTPWLPPFASVLPDMLAWPDTPLWPDTLGPGVTLGLAAVSFVASALTAAFGVGGGTLMLAAMAPVLPLGVLIPVHGLVQLGSNAGRALSGRHAIAPGVLGPFTVGALAGAGLGAATVVTLPESLLRLLLGAFILVVTWVRLPAMPAGRAGRAGHALGGLATTWASVFLGATGPLVSALLARALPQRTSLVATAAAAMSVQHALKIAVFGLMGFALASWALPVAVLVAAGLLGTRLGTTALRGLPERAFRHAFRLGVSLLAIDLMVRALAP